jgi:hypothetical protein
MLQALAMQVYVLNTHQIYPQITCPLCTTEMVNVGAFAVHKQTIEFRISPN